MMTSQGTNHFFSHSKPLPTATLPVTNRSHPHTQDSRAAGDSLARLCLHTMVFASFPPPFQLAHSYHRFSSQETLFGEQCQKDMHSNNFSSFSNICQSARQLHTLAKLLWPLVGSLWLVCLWRPALRKHGAGEEKQP